MPSVILYLGIMLGSMAIWFMILKRPAYEAVFISLVALLSVTGTWENLFRYFNSALSTSLLYSMTAFVTMSIILTKTKVIDGAIAIILALVGKIPGGAGYAAVIASSFMGALSGSGPGNVMASGSITIPAMKKTGFPAELAGNIESNASCLGNLIPPSSNIVAAYGAFMALYPQSDLTTGQFWIVLWGVSIWFILLKMLTVWGFCKYYRVKPLPKEDIPQLRTVLRKHWQGLMLPVIILTPFLLDYLFKDNLFTARLGETGAKYFSSSMLLFIAGIVSFYAVIICNDRKLVTPHSLAKMIGSSIKSISPTIFVCFIGYTIGGIFSDVNVAGEMEQFMLSMNVDRFGMVLFLCVATCLLGMVVTGSSLIVVFGSVFITALVSVGVDPILAAAMLPCICGIMSNITPPLAPGLYAGMSLAEADFGKTVKNDLWWVAGQFILQVVVLMGWLPILGL